MMCEQLPELEIVKTFNNPQKLLEAWPVLDFDLCISDIEMPGMNGLQLAQLLRDKMIIFTTAYKEHAAEAFEIDAVDYLTKPVKKERLQKAVMKALDRFNQKASAQQFVSLNSDKGKTMLYFHQIIMIRTALNDSRDKEVLLTDGSWLLLKNINFESLLGQLPESDFCRINKKEVVAVKAIKFYSQNEITLRHPDKNGKELTLILSETYRPEFLQKVKI
jgi:DNA-binding LytR/AlgR family response regulator